MSKNFISVRNVIHIRSKNHFVKQKVNIDTMFVVVKLNQSNEKLVIPVKWIYSFDIVQVLNYGLSRTKSHIIFYSLNLQAEPNFRLPLRDLFESGGDGCYKAHFWYLLETKENAEEYMKSRRHLLPAIYNQNLEKYHWGPEKTQDAQAHENVIPVIIKQEPGVMFLNAPGMTIVLSEVSGSASVDSTCALAQSLNTVCLNSNHATDSPNSIENNASAVSSSDATESTAINTNPFLDCDQSFEMPNSPEEITQITSTNPFLDSENSIFGTPEVDDVDINIINQNIKVEERIEYLNEEGIIEIIDDDFVALRHQLTVDHEDVDSEEELKAEFDFLVQGGKKLPYPIKLEAQTTEENGCDSNEDVVLGEIPRKTCEETHDRFKPEYGVTVKYSLYTLLEFYNAINDGADGSYYDEKFVRLLCTGIKLKGHLNQIGSYDLNDKLVMFVKDVFKVRVGANERRMKWFDDYLEKQYGSSLKT